MACGVVIGNSEIERETLHIVEKFNGTTKVFLNMNGGQHWGMVQHMFEKFLEVHVVQVIVLLSFEQLSSLKCSPITLELTDCSQTWLL